MVTLAFSTDGALLGDVGAGHESQSLSRASEKRVPIFPPVPHVLAEYGINHGGPDRVAPRFAAGDSILLTVERSGLALQPPMAVGRDRQDPHSPAKHSQGTTTLGLST